VESAGHVNKPWALLAIVIAVCSLCVGQPAFAGSIVSWGDTVPPDGNDFIAIAAGLSQSLALRSDGSIIGWGAGKSGQTGWPNFGQADPPEGNNFVAIAAGYYHNLALKSDGSIVCWGANWYPFFQAVPPEGNGFVAIAAGQSHSLAIRRSCEYELAGDLNDDCKVDFSDFEIMAAHWLIDCNLNPENPACVPK
jgi:hypothetical protein